MIEITLRQLQKMKACDEGKQWFIDHNITAVKPLVTALLQDEKDNYARWLISRLMTHPQKAKWAIYSAKQVLKLFEKKYPKDLRPRKAIKAAKDFLSGKITASAVYAANAAANASAEAAASAARKKKK